MKSKLTIVVFAIAVLFISCKKQKIEAAKLASLQVVNAVSGGRSLQFGTNSLIPNNSAIVFSQPVGVQDIKVFDSGNPNAVYYKKVAEFSKGDVYSLFLTGTVPSIEALYVKDNIPVHFTPVFGIRFVNLVPDSDPISVNLNGEASGSQISSLPYKGVSEFKSISAMTNETSRTFEFRNTETNVLIKSFPVAVSTLPRFQNITLVMVGKLGEESILRINNY